MALRSQASRSKKQRVSRLRRTRRSIDQRYRPQLENLEPRTLMTGFWTQIQTTNPASGPVAGVQGAMLLSNGVVMLAQNTAPNPSANFGISPTQTTWFQLPPTSN